MKRRGIQQNMKKLLIFLTIVLLVGLFGGAGLLAQMDIGPKPQPTETPVTLSLEQTAR